MTDIDINLPMWLAADAAEIGFNPTRIAEAVKFASEKGSEWPRSMYVEDGTYIGSAYVEDKPPYNQPLGPVTPRGGQNGLIWRGGKLVGSWGDTTRPEMTFSIAKSCLALLAGLALDRGLIPSLDSRVGETIKDGGFEDSHNASITWRHFLVQASEWHGTLFDRPDSVDWNRQVGTNSDGRDKGLARELREPGALYEYNDVRVNRFALCLLRVFEEALPEVFRREIMEPLGASNTWRWDGYENSWVEINGRRLQSVPGGGHWGGGIVISARDLARLGALVLGKGVIDGRKLISQEWISEMLTPSSTNANYGLMWWLNTNGALYPSAPESSVFALGAGQHLIWIDHPRDLVVVIRWLHKPDTDRLLGLITDAIQD